MLGASLARTLTAMQYAVLLALALFLGFAFEQFQGEEVHGKAGGVRTFPILAFVGAGLYLIEPHLAIAFAIGLATLGAWLWRNPDAGLLTKATVLLAYMLGPIALTQPLWVAVALSVGAVVLVGSKDQLHKLTTAVPAAEVQTAAMFLLLVGVVLPLLYGQPDIPYTHITPFKVWLAVIAVSGLSYGSYLLQRYVFPQSGEVLTAVLGGLYSSTTVTVVLARRARDQGFNAQICGGIVAATAMMYLRIVAIVSVFDRDLGLRLAIPMIALGAIGLGAAFFLDRLEKQKPAEPHVFANPLQLGTALVFAGLLVLISALSQYVQATLGAKGVLALAAVVGVTDIDPFVLSLAQSGAASIGVGTAACAVMIASSSNNLLKAAYTAAFSRKREAVVPMGALVALSALGLIAAWIVR